MGNPNATTRTILGWTHVLAGPLIRVLVYAPAHGNETFALLTQTAVVSAVTLTGPWRRQQARLRRLYRRTRGTRQRTGTDGPKRPEGTRRDVAAL